MYKIVFFVPDEYVESVKNALFSAGAGAIGNYDMCAWQVAGVGQFRPLEGSNAYIGCVGQLERVSEHRVEMVCRDECIKAALVALRTAHPYEEPAIDVWRLEDFS